MTEQDKYFAYELLGKIQNAMQIIDNALYELTHFIKIDDDEIKSHIITIMNTTNRIRTYFLEKVMTLDAENEKEE
ncbi:MAG: hypothetical protein PHS93_08280 [Candidatus Omnitrophica bacterium]|nr:hypothetical protein [Candidatus Omnitrophota bacterium]MDD5589129.1 hypothetical protein [Candidatus Nanoarchaeia archaeon]